MEGRPPSGFDTRITGLGFRSLVLHLCPVRGRTPSGFSRTGQDHSLVHRKTGSREASPPLVNRQLHAVTDRSIHKETELSRRDILFATKSGSALIKRKKLTRPTKTTHNLDPNLCGLSSSPSVSIYANDSSTNSTTNSWNQIFTF